MNKLSESLDELKNSKCKSTIKKRAKNGGQAKGGICGSESGCTIMWSNKMIWIEKECNECYLNYLTLSHNLQNSSSKSMS